MIQIHGIADICLAMGFHNYEPIEPVGDLSVNKMPINLTPLGALVRRAKYDNDPEAISALAIRLVGAALLLQPIDRVHYVPHSNTETAVTEILATEITRVLSLPHAEPAYDARNFLQFTKAMTAYEIGQMVRHSGVMQTEERSGSSCLIVDDTIRSGSTLQLATRVIQRRYGYSKIKALCATKVYTMTDGDGPILESD